jgi:hypothetical protein
MNNQQSSHAKRFTFAYAQFNQMMFTDDGVSNACELHKVFGTYESAHHNCLGCNFENVIRFAANSYVLAQNESAPEFAGYHWLLALYLVIERVDVVLRLINFDPDAKAEKFATSQSIRRWANFLKHPKSFMLTHHAEFFFEGDPDSRGKMLIDSDFVSTYYASKDRNIELYRLTANASEVGVSFPDIMKTTFGFCAEFNQFLKMCGEKDSLDLLRNQSTYENYFSHEDSSDV